MILNQNNTVKVSIPHLYIILKQDNVIIKLAKANDL